MHGLKGGRVAQLLMVMDLKVMSFLFFKKPN